MMNEFKPEGTMCTPIYSKAVLDRAMTTGKILEGRARLCTENRDLLVDLGCMKGIIFREDAAMGIREGHTRDIAVISRVNKMCCFTVKGYRQINGDLYAVLSRREAQEKALAYMLKNLQVGDITDARITHLDRFGAFADIGCGVVGLISIENISVSRISHASDRFYSGQDVKVVVRDIDTEKGRFFLSHKELLGTWAENAADFSPGQTVFGCVRSLEDYGVFIELTPNLSGLAEAGDYGDMEVGTGVSVYIKSILPEKMKIKLSVVEVFREKVRPPEKYRYFTEEGHMDSFVYFSSETQRRNETIFKKT